MPLVPAEHQVIALWAEYNATPLNLHRNNVLYARHQSLEEMWQTLSNEEKTHWRDIAIARQETGVVYSRQHFVNSEPWRGALRHLNARKNFHNPFRRRGMIPGVDDALEDDTVNYRPKSPEGVLPSVWGSRSKGIEVDVRDGSEKSGSSQEDIKPQRERPEPQKPPLQNPDPHVLQPQKQKRQKKPALKKDQMGSKTGAQPSADEKNKGATKDPAKQGQGKVSAKNLRLRMELPGRKYSWLDGTPAVVTARTPSRPASTMTQAPAAANVDAIMRDDGQASEPVSTDGALEDGDEMDCDEAAVKETKDDVDDSGVFME